MYLGGRLIPRPQHRPHQDLPRLSLPPARPPPGIGRVTWIYGVGRQEAPRPRSARSRISASVRVQSLWAPMRRPRLAALKPHGHISVKAATDSRVHGLAGRISAVPTVGDNADEDAGRAEGRERTPCSMLSG
jgi:hypothetical protein